jgi:1-acyl-sn-glycerol-3-phosphate acyltransferase
MLRASFVTFVTFLYVLVAGTPVVIYAQVSGDSRAVYRVGRWGARMALWLAGVRLEVQGSEKIFGEGVKVFMPNHQSNCDPPALLSVLPRVRFIAKREFFRVPILGMGMRVCGFIPLERQNRERAIAAVEQAVDALKAGHSFLAFPEGTRSRDGRLQPFKKGVFVMAIKAGVPIVPISISGATAIMPKGKFAIRPGRVRITVHDPIPATGLSLDNRESLSELTRRAVISGLAAEEWPVGENKGHQDSQMDVTEANPAPLS